MFYSVVDSEVKKTSAALEAFDRTPNTHLLTPQALSAHLDVPLSSIYYWVHRREIPYIKVGRLLRFELHEVLEYFRARTAAPVRPCAPRAGRVSKVDFSSLKTRFVKPADYFKKE